MQLNLFPDYAAAAGEKFPAYATTMTDLYVRRRDTIMAAYDAHTLMSTQALNSKAVQQALKDILLNHALLWEALRAKATENPAR